MALNGGRGVGVIPSVGHGCRRRRRFARLGMRVTPVRSLAVLRAIHGLLAAPAALEARPVVLKFASDKAARQRHMMKRGLESSQPHEKGGVR